MHGVAWHDQKKNVGYKQRCDVGKGKAKKKRKGKSFISCGAVAQVRECAGGGCVGVWVQASAANALDDKRRLRASGLVQHGHDLCNVGVGCVPFFF